MQQRIFFINGRNIGKSIFIKECETLYELRVIYHNQILLQYKTDKKGHFIHDLFNHECNSPFCSLFYFHLFPIVYMKQFMCTIFKDTVLIHIEKCRVLL